jgi:hypothetical protein
MIHIADLTEVDAKTALAKGEFDTGILGAGENVLVILSQAWCSQWQYLSKDLETHAATDKLELQVFVFLYNRSPLFAEFLNFKERTWGNDEIPYLRFYKNSVLVHESNFMPVEEIIRRFAG